MNFLNFINDFSGKKIIYEEIRKGIQRGIFEQKKRIYAKNRYQIILLDITTKIPWNIFQRCKKIIIC